MTLNPEQLIAVQKTEGRVLILAGAGTGKTRVLTMRMAYLIQKGVSPQSILGLTFTNKAAEEMRERLALLIGAKEAIKVTLATFHSFCMQVLKAEISLLGYTESFTLYSEKDIERLVKLLARDILNHEGELPSISESLNTLQWAKCRGLAPSSLPKKGHTWLDTFNETLYTRLLESMKVYNAIDFDHLLTLTVDLFKKFPAVLKKYQQRFLYIMIDEYQDTNTVQFQLAAQMASLYQNLCVVGDDDQSIYGWRGAEVENILSFDNATVIKLEQNYRSTQTILQAANEVIQKNRSRHPKRLWSALDIGDPIEVFHAPTEEKEAQAVIYRLNKLRETRGWKWSDLAILYRSNALSRPFEAALMQYRWKEDSLWHKGIPYQIFGGTAFYERREIKDLLAYLRLIVNPLDSEALLRIINVPRRGIGEQTLGILTQVQRSSGKPLLELLKDAELYVDDNQTLHAKAKENMHSFYLFYQEAVKIFQTLPLDSAMEWLLETINYKKAIDEEVKSERMRDFKWENVRELVDSMSRYALEENHSLHAFVTTLSLNDHNLFKKKGQHTDAVQMMTLHSSKGLEFKGVFIIGLEEGLLPHEKSVKENGIEEERRLFYVGITRAQQKLTLSMSRQRQKMGKLQTSSPCQFLFDIPKQLIVTTTWDQ